MYRTSYAETLGDDCSEARSREREALNRAVQLLERASQPEVDADTYASALMFTRRLWSFLVIDLSSEGNALPEKMRADLISIGFWIMREVDRLQDAGSRQLSGLIEIQSIIRDGLR